MLRDVRRETRRRRRLRDWVLARKIDQVCSLGIAALALWILWSIPSARADNSRRHGNVMTGEEAIFQAYDCSAPVNVSAVSLDNAPPECSEEALKKEQQSKKYLLLQRADRIPLDLNHIDATYLRMAFVCGGASHSAIASREWRMGMRYNLTSGAAARIWEEMHWRRPVKYAEGAFKVFKNRKSWQEWPAYPLKLGEYRHFDWQKIGVDYHGKNDVDCKGQKAYGRELLSYKKEDLTNMVLTYIMKVGLFRRPAFWFPGKGGEPGQIQLQTGEKLACAAESGHCNTLLGTFTWKLPKPDEACTYYTARETEGIDIATKGTDGKPTGAVTYLSTDGSMIRVEKKGRSFAACGGVITATNFKRLFLTEDIHVRGFKKQLHASEASAYLYSDVADHFIHEKVQDDLERAVLGLQQYECRRDAAVRSRQYARKAAEQQTLVEGHTAHLGGGKFFTARGDGGFVYSCKPTLVTARKPNGTCYSAMEVTLTEREEQYYRRVHEIEAKEGQDAPRLPKFFMELKTHRLLTTAASERCLDILAPAYRNLRGNWVSVRSKGLHLAVPPLPLEDGVDGGYWKYQRTAEPL